MNIIDIAYALTAPVEAVMFFMFFDVFFERRKQFPVWQYLIGIIVLAVLIRLSNYYLLFKAGNVIGMVISVFIVSLFFYNSSFEKRIFLPVVLWAIWSSIEIITLNSITLIFNITSNEVMNTSEYIVLGIIISKSIQLIIAYIIYIKGLFKEIKLNKKYWMI